MDTANRRLRVAAARVGFLTSGLSDGGDVTDVVVASWQRSLQAGVDATSAEAVFHADLDTSSRLMRCSMPIIDRLSAETADIPLSIALTDGKARVLTRVDTSKTIGMLLDNVSFAAGFDYTEGGIGTNGVGTVFESGQPIHIVGPEHFHDRLQPFACSGAPIRDPLSGRIEGVLDISCLTEHSSPLMHSLVRSAALEIERNLLIDRSHCQQSLFESFMRVDSRSRGAVLAVGSAVLIANATAQNLLTATEQAHVQEYAKYVMGRQERTVDQIELGSGKVVKIRGTRILAGSDIAGMVVEIALVSESLPALTSASLTSAVPTGWPELPTASPVIREPSLVSDSGQSAVWKRACSDISAALSEHRPLLVMGETGTGKFSLVAEIYHRVNPGGRSVLMDAGGISRHSYPDADIAVQATTLPTLYIFRNIDQLSTDGLEELNTFLLMLADSDRDVYIAATLSDASIDSDLPFREPARAFPAGGDGAPTAAPDGGPPGGRCPDPGQDLARAPVDGRTVGNAAHLAILVAAQHQPTRGGTGGRSGPASGRRHPAGGPARLLQRFRAPPAQRHRGAGAGRHRHGAAGCRRQSGAGRRDAGHCQVLAVPQAEVLRHHHDLASVSSPAAIRLMRPLVPRPRHSDGHPIARAVHLAMLRRRRRGRVIGTPAAPGDMAWAATSSARSGLIGGRCVDSRPDVPAGPGFIQAPGKNPSLVDRLTAVAAVAASHPRIADTDRSVLW